MDLATLGLEIESDGVVTATDRLKDFEGQATRTNKSTDLLLKAFGALGAVLSVRQLIQYTNTWTDLNSRVEIATGNLGRGAATMQRIAEMARRTYSPLEQTAQAFLSNATALRELGYSTEETLDYVEAINNALVVSGAKGQQAESVMNALNKSMGLGKLSGENLNTVLASGGRITEVLAAHMGVTTNELRKLGAEGKLTGDTIYQALVGALEQLREEADSMPATIGDAFVLLNNSIMQTVGNMDQMTGASSRIAEAIIWVADNIDSFVPAVLGLATAIGASLVPGIWAMTAALLANPLTWVALGVGAVATAIAALIQRMGGLEEAYLSVQMVALDVWERIKAGGQSLADVMQGIALAIQGSFIRAWAAIAEGFANLISSMGGAAGMLGLDASGATAYAKSLHTQAASYEAGSSIAFNNAGRNWDRATGPGLQMDTVGAGTSLQQMHDTLGPGNAGGGGGGGGGGTGSGGGAAEKADAYQKLTQSILDNIDAMRLEAETMGMSEFQASKLMKAQELLKAAAEAKIPITTTLVEEINSMAQAYSEAEMAVAAAEMRMANREPWEIMASELQRLDEMVKAGAISWQEYHAAAAQSMAGAANATLGSLGQITGALASAFQGNKAFAVANAVINTAEGVTKALGQGGMFAFPIAAAIAAAGAAQIATIMSANPGGGSSASVRAPSAPSIQNAPQRQQTERAPDRLDVTLHGLDKNAMYSGDNIERLIGLIEERSGDGRILNIKVA